MGENDGGSIYKELEHLRLVHFTVLVMSGVLLYIYLAVRVWSLTPRLQDELGQLAHAVHLLQLADKEEILRDWPSIDDEILFAARRDLLRVAGEMPLRITANDALRSMLQVRDVDPAWPDLDRESLRTTRSRLELHRWEWQLFDHFDLNLEQIAAWRKAIGRPDSGVSIQASIVAKGSSADALNVEVVVDVQRCIMVSAPDAGSMPSVDCSISQKERLLLAAHVVTRIEHRSLPPSWFSTRFPTVASVWDRVQPITLKDALSALDSDRAAEIYGKRATLLGLEIEGRHLGVLGPVLLFIALAYLCAYLWQLLHAQRAGPMLSPWLGAMPWMPVRLLSACTLLCAPVASYCLLTAFAGLDWWLAAPLCAVFLGAPVIFAFSWGGKVAARISAPRQPPSAPPR